MDVTQNSQEGTLTKYDSHFHLYQTWQQVASNRHRRITEIQRNTQQFIQFFRMLVNPFCLPCLVRYTDSNITTVSISNTTMAQLKPRVNLNALAVKCLVFITGYYFLYSHIIFAMELHVNNYFFTSFFTIIIIPRY